MLKCNVNEMKFIVGKPVSKGVGLSFQNFLKKGGLDFSHKKVEVGVGFALKKGGVSVIFRVTDSF